MFKKEEIEKHFRALDLSIGASFQDVKKAHRFLVQTFHEDKYPAGSAQREMAKEKMIQLNDAYEQLQKFFEVYPEGWCAFEEHLEEVEMDWQTWEEKQQTEADGAIASWREEERVRRENVNAEEQKTRRQNIFNLSMVCAWLLIPILWCGHMETRIEHSVPDILNANYLHQTMNYKYAMGTATRQDGENLRRAVEKNNADVNTDQNSLIYLYLYVAALVYISAFPRPRRYIANWLETGVCEDSQSKLENVARAQSTHASTASSGSSSKCGSQQETPGSENDSTNTAQSSAKTERQNNDSFATV